MCTPRLLPAAKRLTVQRACRDSGSACIFLVRQDRAKRSRHERPESEELSLVSDGGVDAGEGDVVDDIRSGPRSEQSVQNQGVLMTGPAQDPLSADWDSWKTWSQPDSVAPEASATLPAQHDWNSFMTTFATQAAKYLNHENNPHPLPVAPSLPVVNSLQRDQHVSGTAALQPTAARAEAVESSRQTTRQTISPNVVDASHSEFETVKGLAMISLEAAAEPHYVGESSGSLWTTIISKGLNAPRAGRNTQETSERTSRTPSPSRQAAARAQLARPLPPDVATRVLETVFRHLHPRYPFMDWPAFEYIWRARDQILLAVAQDRIHDKEAGVAAFFVLMILAIGSQYCQSQTPAGLLRAYDYYLLAQPYLRWIVQLHNLANVQGLLLLAIYSLRDTRGPSIWYISGVAIRLCIGLGLHRARTPHNTTPHVVEVRKRIFWTCYTLDRMVSLLLGRPPGISDDDIDAELPAVELDQAGTRPMASAAHYIRLKQLESKIQRAVLTIGRTRLTTIAEVHSLLQAVDEWENDIPSEASLPNHAAVPCCSRDWFLLRAVETKLHLLRPLCQLQGEMAQTFLPRLALCAADGCELQKRTHLKGVPTSTTQLHSTFVCGLALLYTVFLVPSALPLKRVFSAIKAASNTLFAYANQSPNAGPLFEIFEELSSECMDRISRCEPTVSDEANKDWQKASQEAATNLGSDSAIEYADLLRSLGIEMDNEPAALPDGLWDISTFFTSPVA